MSVDYRLLHHFRVSQRREMASRGELPALRPTAGEPAPGEPSEPRKATPERPVAPPARIQVLTHLLNEDR